MTKSEVLKRIAGLKGDQRKSVVCSLIGHSRIVTACFGYVHCARCEAQIADKMGGAGYASAPECVQVGHNCETCRENFKKLDWKDKFLAPNPFVGKGSEHDAGRARGKPRLKRRTVVVKIGRGKGGK